MAKEVEISAFKEHGEHPIVAVCSAGDSYGLSEFPWPVFNRICIFSEIFLLVCQVVSFQMENTMLRVSKVVWHRFNFKS